MVSSEAVGIIYNLRAALDYLIYELAHIDAGKTMAGTQFPIENREERFDGRGATFLKGVSDEHIAAIKLLQPCSGCQWTEKLRDLSNPDKHRHLTALADPVTVSPSPGSTEAIIAGQAVDMRKDLSIRVVFSDGSPIVDVLEMLLSHVTRTLVEFKNEFK